MRFGTVSGVIGGGPGTAWFTVMLHTGETTEVIRDEAVPQALAANRPGWLIDQLVQETLGNELAELGWEVIAVSEPVKDEQVRSRNWTVRKLAELGWEVIAVSEPVKDEQVRSRNWTVRNLG